jgi:carboxyl-terminal processing protease
MSTRLVVLLYLAIAAATQTSVLGQTKVPLEDRVWVASKIYASIPIYFAHWQGAPDLDLDAVYKDYLKAATAAETRWDFDHLTLEFMARLNNGHTDFWDSFLDRAGGAPLGFRAVPVDGKWTVIETQTASLKIGDVLERIDRTSWDQFFQSKRNYIAASSSAAAQAVFCYHKHLFPQQFRLTLAGGAEVPIDRATQQLRPPEPRTTDARYLQPSIAYIKIPSFAEPKYEQFAENAVKQFTEARAILFDVRANGGGSTPTRLLRALMDRPYRDWSQASALSIGLFKAHSRVLDNVRPGQLSERETGYYEAFTEFKAPQLIAPGGVTAPAIPIYRGKIIVLTDFDCGSACEDFIMPLKYSKRATVLGERTRGSSGQPFLFDFNNGMSIRISSRRMYFPDGTEFEGVGITPDIEVRPSIADRRSGVDVVLQRALQLAAE